MRNLLTQYKKREDGFTLVELLIVVLIIGILAAVAIPVYLGIQNQAHKATVRADTNIAVKKVQVALTEGVTVASQYGIVDGSEKGETIQVKASTTTGAGTNDFMVTGNESTLNNPKGAIDYTYQYDSVTGKFSDSDSGDIALGGASQSKVTITTAALADANTTDAYNQAIVATTTNPTGSTVFTITGLPTGYTYASATGTISAPANTGTVGTYPVTVTATNGAATATRNYTLTINAKPTITTATIPNGTVNSAYPATTLAATGSPATYTYAVTSGNLPAGMALSATGVLSGTPTTAGTYTFGIAATNTAGTGPSRSFTTTIASIPAITSTNLPNGTTTAAYNQTVAATGSPAPTFTAATNNWGSCSGEGGTCTLPDSSARQVRYGYNGNYNYLTVTSSVACNNGTFGDPYPGFAKSCDYITATATPGLPAGLSINANSGAITGTPTTGGSWGITVTADNGSTPTTKMLPLTITSPASITTASLPDGSAGTAYNQTITTAGYPGPVVNVTSLGWVTCSGENGTCTLPDSSNYQVRFGANGNYNYKTVSGSVACNNATFGDPAFNTAKSCAYQTGASPLSIAISNVDNSIHLVGSTTSMKAGTYTITVTAANNINTATRTYTLNIN